MTAQPLPIAGKLPIKTLVARQLSINALTRLQHSSQNNPQLFIIIQFVYTITIIIILGCYDQLPQLRTSTD